MFRSALIALFTGISLLAGCDRSEPAPAGKTPAPSARAPVSLSVLVVDDPEMAAGLMLLRGEWNERSGGEIEIAESTLEALQAGQDLTSDLVVYPSVQLGALVERRWLREVRDATLHGEALELSTILPSIRNRTMRYGNHTFALSLGEQPLLRRVLEQASDNWSQLDQLAALPPASTAEFVCRAAGYAAIRPGEPLLFDAETMEPLLGGPCFVRALEEMVLQNSRGWDTDGTSSLIATPGKVQSSLKNSVFQLLPAASETYDSLLQRWQPAEAPAPLAVLGFSGRSISVTAATRNAASAFKLLEWLGSGETAKQLSRRSTATLWFRALDTPQADRWPAGKSLAEGAAGDLTRLLTADNSYLLPRLPGIEEYLDALDRELAPAFRGESSVEQALQRSARAWQNITQRRGVHRQLRAYRRHLGLEEWKSEQ